MDSLPPPAASLQAASPAMLLAPGSCTAAVRRHRDPLGTPGGRDGAAPQAGLVLLPLLPQQAAHH